MAPKTACLTAALNDPSYMCMSTPEFPARYGIMSRRDEIMENAGQTRRTLHSARERRPSRVLAPIDRLAANLDESGGRPSRRSNQSPGAAACGRAPYRFDEGDARGAGM